MIYIFQIFTCITHRKPQDDIHGKLEREVNCRMRNPSENTKGDIPGKLSFVACIYNSNDATKFIYYENLQEPSNL